MSIRLALSFFVVLGLGIAVLVFSIGPEGRWRASQTLASQAQRRIATKTFESYLGKMVHQRGEDGSQATISRKARLS